MAWNQSTTYSKKRTIPEGGNWRLLWVLAIAVICVAIGVWVFIPTDGLPENDTDSHTAPTKTKIADAKPSISKARSDRGDVQQPIKKQERLKSLPTQRVGELRDGYRLLPSGRKHRVLGTIKARDTSNEWLEKTFPEPSDQLIAGLITIEPGESIVGNPESYYRNFAEQFQASLLNPIRIEKDDDQYTRELKEAVKTTREELVARLKAGEDIVQIMTETRKQYQELGLYRNELKDIVRKNLSDGEISAAEYEDLVKAANIMLEDRGSKPLDLPETFKKYVEIMNLDVDERETDNEE